MRTPSTVENDSAIELIPNVICHQPDDVTEVRVEPGYRLFVRFVDGTEGIVELDTLIRSSRAGVFAVLEGTDLFAQARVELGAVTWPGGIDLAPDAMYAALREGDVWTPS